MSRSFRKTPICGFTTANSNKEDKRLANRRFRRASRNRIKSNREPFYRLREVCNVWDFAKDGKMYYDKEAVKRYPKVLRK